MHTNKAHFFKVRAVFLAKSGYFFLFSKGQERPLTLSPASCASGTYFKIGLPKLDILIKSTIHKDPMKID